MKNIKKILSLLFVTFIMTNTFGQNTQSKDVDVLRGIADKILANSEFSFTDEKTGEQYASVKNLPLSPYIKVTNVYNDWKYQNGVLNLALIKLSELTSDQKYKEHVYAKYDFVLNSGNQGYFEKQVEAIKSGEVDGKPSREFAKLRGKTQNASFWQLFRLKKLDDFGAQGAALIEVYKEDPKEIYLKYIERFAKFVREEECRLEDGTLARPIPREYTVWSDDLYMSLPFMARYAALTGDTEMMDDAVFQLLRYFDILFDKEKGLYFHCYFTELETTGVAHWGRANGWVVVATVELLSLLPEDHPQRDQLIENLEKHIQGLARHQSGSGCWRQVLDKTDSYTETSCTAMFIYGISKAVNNGWIDKDYTSVAKYGWEGLMTKISDEYDVKDICKGSSTDPSLSFYYNRPALVNDTHGLATVLLAGTEYLKIKEFYEFVNMGKYLKKAEQKNANRN